MRVTPLRNVEEGWAYLYEHRTAYELIGIRCSKCKFRVRCKDLPLSARRNNGAAASVLRGRMRAHIRDVHGGA